MSSENQDSPSRHRTPTPKKTWVPPGSRHSSSPCPGVWSLNVSLVQSKGLRSWTGPSWGRCTTLWIIFLRLYSSTAPQRPVHPEDSTNQRQEQGKLQEDQEQEVDTAEQGPVGVRRDRK